MRAYSLGMKQRLGIANALLSPRELLVLDEPTNGLDPQGTREVRSLIRALAEVEQVCSHVGVMSAGKLVAQGTLDAFRDEGDTQVLVTTPDAGLAREVLVRLGLEAGAGAVDGPAGNGDEVAARLGAVAPETVVAALVEAGVRVRGFETVHASLEQRFVELTGEGFDVVQ